MYTTISVTKEVSDLLGILSNSLSLPKATLIEKSVKFYLKNQPQKKKNSSFFEEMRAAEIEFLKKKKLKTKPFDIYSLELADAYE